MSNPFANFTPADVAAKQAKIDATRGNCARNLERGMAKVYEQPNNPVGAVETNGPEPTPPKTLDRRTRKQKGSSRCLVRVRMVATRHRLLDPDAVAFSFKPLTDLIAKDLGVDDADSRVEWEWCQVKTAGEEGVIVIIEEVKP